jgi:hypothetical protein
VANLKDQWAEGHFNSENVNICTTANVSAVSQLRAFQELIDIDENDINQELDDASKEQLGMVPTRERGTSTGM